MGFPVGFSMFYRQISKEENSLDKLLHATVNQNNYRSEKKNV